MGIIRFLVIKYVEYVQLHMVFNVKSVIRVNVLNVISVIWILVQDVVLAIFIIGIHLIVVVLV